MASFLNFYPQYTLRDLISGGLTMGEFIYLVGGMLDNINPQSTEPFEEKIARATREAHVNASKGLS